MSDTFAVSSSNDGISGSFFDEIDDSPVTNDQLVAVGGEPRDEAETGGDTKDASAETAALSPPDIDSISEEDTTSKEVPKVVPPTARKTYKLAVGESIQDVGLDATFEIPVDGQKQKVTLEQLTQEYAGKTAWDKKFNQLAVDKKTFEGERSKLLEDRGNIENASTLLGNFFELASTGKSREALQMLIDASGYKDYSVKQFRQQMVDYAKSIEQMTPEDLERQDREEDAKFYREKYEALQRDIQQRHAAEESDKQLSQTLSQIGLSRDTYNGFRQELLQAGVADQEADQTFVLNYAAKVEQFKTVGDAIRAVDAELLKDKSFIEQVVSHKAKFPEETVESLADKLRQVLGQKQAQAASQRINANKPKAVAKTPKQTRAGNGQFASIDEAWNDL